MAHGSSSVEARTIKSQQASAWILMLLSRCAAFVSSILPLNRFLRSTWPHPLLVASGSNHPPSPCHLPHRDSHSTLLNPCSPCRPCASTITIHPLLSSSSFNVCLSRDSPFGPLRQSLPRGPPFSHWRLQTPPPPTSPPPPPCHDREPARQVFPPSPAKAFYCLQLPSSSGSTCSSLSLRSHLIPSTSGLDPFLAKWCISASAALVSQLLLV